MAYSRPHLAKTWFMVFLVTSMMIEPAMSDTEKPSYKVMASEGNIQIRQYQPMLIAEVEVQGTRDNASTKGFRLLANYIFGNNTVQQDMAMTAPVQQQTNTKIAMTAPVQQEAVGNEWKISFVMPSKYTLANIPIPSNDAVTLREIPAKRFIAIRFSGSSNTKNITKHEQQLRDHIEQTQLNTASEPKYAFYSSPWTPSFFRRNEVMFEIL